MVWFFPLKGRLIRRAGSLVDPLYNAVFPSQNYYKGNGSVSYFSFCHAAFNLLSLLLFLLLLLSLYFFSFANTYCTAARDESTQGAVLWERRRKSCQFLIIFFHYPWCFWASCPETLMLPKSEELPLLCVHPALRSVLLNSTLTFIKGVGKQCPDLAQALNIQLPALRTQWVILGNTVIIRMALSTWPSTCWDNQCMVQPLPQRWSVRCPSRSCLSQHCGALGALWYTAEKGIRKARRWKMSGSYQLFTPLRAWDMLHYADVNVLMWEFGLQQDHLVLGIYTVA